MSGKMRTHKDLDAWRMGLDVVGEEEILLLTIGTHDEVY